MTYQQSLDYLASLNTFGMRLGLSRICRLAELLGNPQDAYKTVHITGTNGKGSVSALAAAALSASGLRTGLFTSPHLVSYNERMCVDGAKISDEDFARMLSRTRDAAERMIAEGEESPTQFEVLTAAAFLYRPLTTSSIFACLYSNQLVQFIQQLVGAGADAHAHY